MSLILLCLELWLQSSVCATPTLPPRLVQVMDLIIQAPGDFVCSYFIKGETLSLCKQGGEMSFFSEIFVLCVLQWVVKNVHSKCIWKEVSSPLTVDPWWESVFETESVS